MEKEFDFLLDYADKFRNLFGGCDGSNWIDNSLIKDVSVSLGQNFSQHVENTSPEPLIPIL